MNRITIHDSDDRRIDPYRSLTTSKITRQSGRFIAEGRFVVQRLLASDYQIESLFVSEHAIEAVSDWLPDDIPIYVMPRRYFEELIGFKFHQGVLACGYRKPQQRLADLAHNPDDCLYVVVPHVCDPENVGQIIRTATAFGADGVLFGPGCADPFSRRVLRVSMGNVLFVPIVESGELLDELKALQSTDGFQIVAAVLDDKAVPLETIERPRRMCLLLGNEADGLDNDWLQIADIQATIPMRLGTDSLNVAVASGVFLYHFTRRVNR